MVEIVMSGNEQNVFPQPRLSEARKIGTMMEKSGTSRGFFNSDYLHIFDSYGFTHDSYIRRMEIKNRDDLHSLIFFPDGTIILADQFGSEECKLCEIFTISQVKIIEKIYKSIGVRSESILVVEMP